VQVKHGCGPVYVNEKGGKQTCIFLVGQRWSKSGLEELFAGTKLCDYNFVFCWNLIFVCDLFHLVSFWMETLFIWFCYFWAGMTACWFEIYTSVGNSRPILGQFYNRPFSKWYVLMMSLSPHQRHAVATSVPCCYDVSFHVTATSSAMWQPYHVICHVLIHISSQLISISDVASQSMTITFVTDFGLHTNLWRLENVIDHANLWRKR
jgi:hypothetical protein